MAAPEREVYSLVGDGSYLMMAQEIVTAVSEGIKLIIVIVQNHGFSSIGVAVGVARVAAVRHLSTASATPRPACSTATSCPIDLAANAESLGADVIRVKTIDEFRDALDAARAATRTTAIHIETDPLAPVPSSESWWDVPVSEVAAAGQHPARPARPTRRTRPNSGRC